MRLQELDILKGLLIICVIVGHLAHGEFLIDVYWFHMPAFFMISGFLWNKNNTQKTIYSYSKKILSRYCIPYLSFMFLFYIFFGREESFLHYVRAIFYGGGTMNRPYTYATWYINVLTLCMISQYYICKYLYEKSKNEKLLRVITIVVLYVIMHLISYVAPLPIPLPWSIENVFGGLFYLNIGYSLKKYSFEKKHYMLLFIPVFVLLLKEYDIYTYKVNMQRCYYHNWIFDMLVPLGFTFLLYLFSKLIKKSLIITKVFSYVGLSCLIIYFTHLAIIFVLRPYNLNMPTMVVICVSIGCLLNYLFDKFNIWLFTGKVSIAS